jgi:hypothetical protein
VFVAAEAIDGVCEVGGEVHESGGGFACGGSLHSRSVIAV